MPILPLTNRIQEYAWGSPTMIPELLGGENPPGTPQAELWMGAHPKAPSQVHAGGGQTTLDRWIATAPAQLLGRCTVGRFGGKLPFLFKVLAAARPLSIQAHPNLEQARAGFRREEDAGIPVDAPQRNYRDDNHKPEILCAVGTFWAMCGFRAPADIVTRLTALCPTTLAAELAALRATGDLRRFFTGLLQLPQMRRDAILAEALAAADAGGDAATEWLRRAHADYPGDIGALSPCILNLVELQPGEALFTEAGVLHAYLHGLGIELMANSDNVIRGGLTPKHIDIPELIRTVRFEPYTVRRLAPERRGPGEMVYRTPAAEFRLSRLSVSHEEPISAVAGTGMEILLCTAGAGTATATDGGDAVAFRRGDSLVVSADVVAYTLTGAATLFKAAVPTND